MNQSRSDVVAMEDDILLLSRQLAAERSIGALLVTQVETQIKTWRAIAADMVKDVPAGCESLFNCSARIHLRVADQLEQALKAVLSRREPSDDEMWDAMHTTGEEA